MKFFLKALADETSPKDRYRRRNKSDVGNHDSVETNGYKISR